MCGGQGFACKTSGKGKGKCWVSVLIVRKAKYNIHAYSKQLDLDSPLNTPH